MTSTTPKTILKKYFGYDTFRPLQESVIEAAMQNKDCLVIMPTGGGKSVCYQIPALLKTGISIVISPLIALMKDQVESLKANGIEADFLNSTQDYQEQAAILEKAKAGITKLLYIAPEKLFGNEEQSLISGLNVSLFAVDESHCISSWGHDFRPEYRKLDVLKTNYPNIPIMALTATADKLTRRDICQQLGMPLAKEFITNFDRPNIALSVLPGRNRMQQIQEFLRDKPNQSGIVYCLSRKGTESVTQTLQKMGFNADYYHAGRSAQDRSRIQENFIKDDLQIIVATVAFGMGIDKSNVRWVIHYNLPGNIESFYQEIGRSGRDGEAAESLLFYSYADIIQRKSMIDEAGDKPQEQMDVLHAKLDRMKQFAEAQHCRRKILLSYFNQDLQHDCLNCDVCKNPPKGFDGSILAQKALSTIARADQKIAMGMLIDILRGSKNQYVLRFNYHKLSTFGIGNDLKSEEWAEYISQMLNLGAMEIAYDEGHCFKLSDISWQILKGHRKVELTQFLSFEERRAKTDEKTKTIKQKDLFKNELFDKLRKLRKEIADGAGVPPYVIFHDSSLVEMAQHKPLMTSQMLAISGVGELKMQKYGTVFLKAIQDFVRETDVNLGTDLHNQFSEKKGPKEANKGNKLNPKGKTYFDTLELYKKGMSLEAIANARQLSPSTIASHLIKLKTEGEDVDLDKLVDIATLEKVKIAIKESDYMANAPTKILFEYLEEQIGYDQIRLALAVLQA